MNPGLDWQFAQPAWFWLLLVWPLLQLFSPLWRGKTQADTNPNVFFHPRIAAFFKNQTGKPTQSQARFNRLGYGLSFVLKALILISLLAALANPQRQVEQTPNSSSPPVRKRVRIIP